MAKDVNGWPVRKSTNPTLGGKRCRCGNVITVHQARGKRGKFLYTTCDICGTDQRTGKRLQDNWSQYFATMDELLASEQADTEPLTDGHQDEPESITEKASKTLPETGSESRDSEEKAPSDTEATSRTATAPQTETKPWWAIVRGIVLGAICGGAIARF
ncbi:hypothetical protein [Photobacterium alginatilyticum]|uniref:Uncharacterized protein n=1 Tax=Photobacterium alginatilyticum TaxID=1775171 RepID=A0ABW9YNR2_9GAMM|nr:hypothetical protein [Photobacterium alginatilyticum]NBI55463.1 hypothetical protein [Photobacterium alginatilyticum]